MKSILEVTVLKRHSNNGELLSRERQRRYYDGDVDTKFVLQDMDAQPLDFIAKCRYESNLYICYKLYALGDEGRYAIGHFVQWFNGFDGLLYDFNHFVKRKS